jgi:hypothetical protein
LSAILQYDANQFAPGKVKPVAAAVKRLPQVK